MKPIEHLTEATFNATVDRRGLTVIDFWAGWQGRPEIPGQVEAFEGRRYPVPTVAREPT